jgi:predicted ester cyclase
MLDLIENWNRGNVELIDEIYTPNTVLHSMGGLDHVGRAAIKAQRLQFQMTWPDAFFSCSQLIANTNVVVKRWNAVGTNAGGMPGMFPATGIRGQTCGITAHRIEGDRIAETWQNYDLLGILQCQGVLPDNGRTEYAWGRRVYTSVSHHGSSDANIQTQMRAFHELWNGRNYGLIPEIMRPDFCYHDPNNPDFRGHEGYLQLITGWQSATSDDCLFELHETIAEGEYVYTRWTARYGHTGDLMGIPASGRRIIHPGMTISRFRGDKWIEAWNIWDAVSVVSQMGAMPQGLYAGPRSRFANALATLAR